MLFDPFTMLDEMLKEPVRAFVPASDITVSDGDVVVTMDLPGFSREDVELEVLGGYLTVRGERVRPQLAEGTRLTHGERLFGAFERRIRLPEGVDADAITASMDNGVLSLIIPKPEAMKPRAIEIQAGGDRQLTAGTV